MRETSATLFIQHLPSMLASMKILDLNVRPIPLLTLSLVIFRFFFCPDGFLTPLSDMPIQWDW